MKCVWFWKLLKQLFIISLISCFGFWVSSFVSADYSAQNGVYLSAWGGENTVVSKGNFLNNMGGYTSKAIWDSNLWYIFWYRQGNFTLPYMYVATYSRNWGSYCRWASLKTEYYLCDNFTWVITANPQNCTLYSITWNYEIFTNYLNQVTNNDYWYVQYYWSSQYCYSDPLWVCMSTQSTSSICFRYRDTAWTDPLNLHNTDTNFTTLTRYMVMSPWGSNAWGWNNNWWTIWYLPDTNRGVYDAYGENWYYLRNCYSDFSLNNFATSTWWIQQFTETELEDWEYYTWASVIDLYNYYSGWKTFSDWFSYWYMQYRNSISMDSPVNYVWKSKWLWSIAYKFYLAWRSTDNLGFTQYYNYCSYFIQVHDDAEEIGDIVWDNPYDWNPIPSDVSNYINNNNNQYNTWVLWSLSWKDLSFDPSSFYDTLTTKFNDLLSSPWSWYLGIIPPYILMILMALIFIRIIQH